MQISCKQCNSSLTIPDGSTPKFCSECGAQLVSGDQEGGDQTVQQARAAAEMNTVTHLPASRLSSPVGSGGGEIQHSEIGPYRLVRQLGQGGMGTVYEAVHNQTGQSVALKLLMPSLRGTDDSIHRFRRESQIAASLNHPRSTFVYEAGKHKEQFYITMELMDGGTLKDVVSAQGPLEVGRAVDYILDIIDGLKVAHAAGIVHRDLKPSNCFLDRDGRVKVGDFGLAKSFLGDSQLTQTGTFMGTPQYAAPEQLRSVDVDDRVDIYAVGATLFYLLAGKPCFRGNPAQVIASIASEPPPKVSEFVNGVPRPLVRLIAQTMEKDPARRPQSLEILRDMLLPYSTRGASLADIGRRMAAFFIDITIAATISAMVRMVLAILSLMFTSPLLNPNQASSIALQVGLVIAYFVICEHYYGRGVGKWLLGMRVIGSNSESPGFLAATLRAVTVPGLSWLASTLPVAMITAVPEQDVRGAVDTVTQLQVIGLLSWIPSLICMMTARRSNGYQGIHELISGTRVVRLSGDLEFRRMDSLPITAPVRLESERPFGPFQAVGRFGDGMVPVTYLATDPELGRDVWIYDDVPPTATSDARRFSTRVRRLRMIHDGRQSDENWFVTESVKGAPISEVLNQRKWTWQTVRPLLLELTIELQDSAARDILPDNLGVDHVWIDETGRIKLLDFPVVRTLIQNTADAAQPSPAIQPQNKLLLEMLSQFLTRHDVPLHVRQLLQELQDLADDDTMLAHAESRLSQFADRPSNWNWDDRLGVLAISAGLEMGVMTTLVYLAGIACLAFNPYSPLALITSLGIGSLAAFIFGYCFDGGLAFRLSNVAVLRQTDLRAASKLRCALRNAMAWLPLVLMAATGFFMLHYSMQTLPDRWGGESLVQMLLLVLSVPAGLFIAANIIIALFYPVRNIPDYLAGTRLSRQ